MPEFHKTEYSQHKTLANKERSKDKEQQRYLQFVIYTFVTFKQHKLDAAFSKM